jgi:hypothetical protein
MTTDEASPRPAPTPAPDTRTLPTTEVVAALAAAWPRRRRDEVDQEAAATVDAIAHRLGVVRELRAVVR